MSGFVFIVVMTVLVWGMPGLVLSRWLLPESDETERGVTALTLGIVTVAPTTYVLTLLLEFAVSPVTIGVVAMLWTALGLVAQKIYPRTSTTEPATNNRIVTGVVLSASFSGAFLSLPYAINSVDLFWHCPHLASLYLLEDGTGSGLRLWDAAWNQWVQHLFAHPTEPAFGLGPVVSIQRPGNAAFMVQHFALLGTAAPTVALWCADFLVLGGATLLIRRSVTHAGGTVVLALLFWLGTRMLASYQVNENSLALGLSLVLLHLLLRENACRTALVLACGAISGHLLGIRPALLTLVPAILWLLPHWRSRAIYGAASLLAVLPWLLTNALGLDGLFAYPQLSAGLEPQAFLGFSFTFHPLNWPVADALMTSPHHPYPTLVRLPLEVIQAFGAPLLVLASIGAIHSLRQHSKVFWGAVLWLLPIPAFLMLIVALDYQKQSYVLLSLAPLPLLIGHGADVLWMRNQRTVVLATVVLVAFLAVPKLLTEWRLPVDDRRHIDHNADVRDEQSHEERRKALTQLAWLPELSEELALANAVTTSSLLLHADFASDRRDRKMPVLAGPMVVWASLTGDWPKPFRAQTSSVARIPPNYQALNGVPGKGPSTGRLLFLVTLPAPAPKEVTVALRPLRGSVALNVLGQGERVNESRVLSLLVVDRTRPHTSGPVIVVDGERIKTHTVTLWHEEGKQWRPQPILAATEPWAYHMGPSGFGIRSGAAPQLSAGPNVETDCHGEQHRVERVCIEKECVWALTTRNGQIRRLLVAGAQGMRGARIAGWGTSYAQWLAPLDSCAKQWLNVVN